MKLFIVKDIVRDLLIKHQELRDNDSQLILNVWAKQRPDLTEETTRFKDFAILFREGLLASTESIRRVRQKMQEEHPELRGKKYNQRHEHQDSIKEELRAPEMKKGGTP